MRKIAVLTSGGDAPGMNACIRAVVLTAAHYNLHVFGYLHGYNGLLQQEYRQLTVKDVANMIQVGGTQLRSARCKDFKHEWAAQVAAKNLDVLGIEALIAIGGDGTLKGAEHLSRFWSGNIIGVPGTIDNDICGTDATIGYYTAIETALDSIDKVRDTAEAFERIFLVEVMGREAGFLGLSAAVASAADMVVLPERFSGSDAELAKIVEHIQIAQLKQGNLSYIIVVTENIWPGGINELANTIEQQTGVECRPVVLGHVQRGGSPSSQDRLLATKLGAYAVEMAVQGKTAVMVGEQKHDLVCTPFADCFTTAKNLDPYLVKIQQQLFDIVQRP